MSGNKSTCEPYQEVTDRITAALERGTVPWHRPWSISQGRPMSIDGRPYNGINALLLGLSEYADNRWGTFKTVQAHGGRVRKGERGTFVVFFKPLEVKDESAPNGKRTVPMLRHFYVFNVEQCDGLNIEPLAAATHDVEPVAGADTVLAGYSNAPTVAHGGDRASYSRTADHVQMPIRERFETAGSYYLTLWHELTHSTGHGTRLARSDLAEFERFGDASYSREELVAEIGSAMIAARVGVVAPDIEQSAAYVAGWLRALRDDRRLIVSAASRAQKAGDWILGEQAA
jgi:antirestriction protein ArdC